jgi:hypothetical protein
MSDYFKVRRLKRLVLKTIRDNFSIDTAASYLSFIVTCEDSKLQSQFCRFVASNYISLSNNDFPFHKVGKEMLLLIFQMMSNRCYLYHEIAEEDEQLGINYGNPSRREFYSGLMEADFSDFTLLFKGRRYAVHKFILNSRSVYFQKNLKADSPDHFVPDVSESCFYSAFEVFLLVLYTGLVTNENFTRFAVQLFELSVIYQVKNLRKFCLQEIQKNKLTVKTVEEMLKIVRQKTKYVVTSEFAEFIAHQYKQLVGINFPFHKMRKKTLLTVFKKLAARKPKFQYSHSN